MKNEMGYSDLVRTLLGISSVGRASLGPDAQEAINRAGKDMGASGYNLALAEQSMGHQNPMRGRSFGADIGHNASNVSDDWLSGLKQDAMHRRDMRNSRDQMNLEAYFRNKELADRMSLINNFFGGRGGRNYQRKETVDSQQMVNNAGNWEARPMHQTTTTDMTYDLLSQLLRG